MTIGDAIDNLAEAREHLKGGTPEYIAVVAAHDILRDLRESPPQAPAAGRYISESEIQSIHEAGHRASPAQVQALIREIDHLTRGLKLAPAAPSPDLLEAMEREVLKIIQDNGVTGPGRLESLNPITRARIAKYASRLAALASTPRPPEAAPAASVQDVTRLVKAAAAAMEDIEIGDLMQWPKGMALTDALRPFAPASLAPKEADHG